MLVFCTSVIRESFSHSRWGKYRETIARQYAENDKP